MKPPSGKIETANNRFARDVNARQRNTVWPDTVRNGRSVDALLWKGSPNATEVQRVGMAIFGLLFLAFGANFAYLGVTRAALLYPVSALLLVLGLKIFLNAFHH
jgi:hypothetical protein